MIPMLLAQFLIVINEHQECTANGYTVTMGSWKYGPVYYIMKYPIFTLIGHTSAATIDQLASNLTQANSELPIKQQT